MTDNSAGNNETREAVERYIRDDGFALSPTPPGQKNPNRLGWQNERWGVKDISRLWTNGQGVGVLLGAPSNGLVDVDVDWPEARIAARYIMRKSRTSGREICPDCHRWHHPDPLPKKKVYNLPGQGDDRSVVGLGSSPL